MKLIDVTVPLDSNLPTCPGSTPHEMICLPLRLVGADGAPARVLPRRG